MLYHSFYLKTVATLIKRSIQRLGRVYFYVAEYCRLRLKGSKRLFFLCPQNKMNPWGIPGVSFYFTYEAPFSRANLFTSKNFSLPCSFKELSNSSIDTIPVLATNAPRSTMLAIVLLPISAAIV